MKFKLIAEIVDKKGLNYAIHVLEVLRPTRYPDINLNVDNEMWISCYINKTLIFYYYFKDGILFKVNVYEDEEYWNWRLL